MVFNKRRHIRKLGIRSVLKAKQTVSKFKGKRSFIIPTLKLDAADYKK